MFYAFLVTSILVGFSLSLVESANSTDLLVAIAGNGRPNQVRRLSGYKMSKYNLNRMWRANGFSPDYVIRSTAVNQIPYSDLRTTMIVPATSLPKQTHMEVSSIVSSPQSYQAPVAIPAQTQSSDFSEFMQPTYSLSMYNTRGIPSARASKIVNNQVISQAYLESLSPQGVQSSMIQMQTPETYTSVVQNPLATSMTTGGSTTATTMMQGATSATVMTETPSSTAILSGGPVSTSMISQSPSTTTTLVQSPGATVVSQNSATANTLSPAFASLVSTDSSPQSKMTTVIDSGGIKTAATTQTNSAGSANTIVTTPGTVSVAVQPVTTYSPVSISTTPSVTIVPGSSVSSSTVSDVYSSTASNSPITAMSTYISESSNNADAARFRRLENKAPKPEIASIRVVQDTLRRAKKAKLYVTAETNT